MYAGYLQTVVSNNLLAGLMRNQTALNQLQNVTLLSITRVDTGEIEYLVSRGLIWHSPW